MVSAGLGRLLGMLWASTLQSKSERLCAGPSASQADVPGLLLGGLQRES